MGFVVCYVGKWVDYRVVVGMLVGVVLEDIC